MYGHWLFVTTIFIVSTTGHKNDMLYFDKDEKNLSDCIQEQDNFFKYSQSYKNSGILKTISDLAAEKYHKNVVSRNDMNFEVNDLIDKLQRIEEYQWIKNSQLVRVHLEEVIKQAFVKCSVSYFDPSEFLDSWSRLLDYVLVDWSDLRSTGQTRSGRSLLRKFAHQAEKLLKSALNHTTYYPRHNYSMDRAAPYVFQDGSLFSNRRARRFGDRNPLAEKWRRDRILNVHEEVDGDGGFDIFSKYERKGMSKAEYHIELHLIQFYRLLFFVQEMRAKGVARDEDDFYDGKLPCDVMPEELQSIAYNDDSYRDYLIMSRDLSNLEQARVREEDLIFLTDTLIGKVFRRTTCSPGTNVVDESICVDDYTKWREASSVDSSNRNRNKKTDLDMLIDTCFKPSDKVSGLCSLMCEPEEQSIKTSFFGYVLNRNSEKGKSLSFETIRDALNTFIKTSVVGKAM